MQEKYAQLALENTVRLLGIDSPSGYTENAAKYVQAQFAQMGYDAKITRKGGVLIDLGGEDTQDALLLEAHTDTLGGMVAQIKGNAHHERRRHERQQRRSGECARDYEVQRRY